MANHGYVKTRKFMSAEKIGALLSALNESHFKGNLKVEYHNGEGDPSAWGKDVWILSYVSHDREYAGRVCWLNSARSFEMRHGGGGDFAWWIDTVILNEVAVQFNGMISDDGVGGKWPGKVGKYKRLFSYLKRMVRWQKDGKNASRMWYLKSVLEEFVPPEMQSDEFRSFEKKMLKKELEHPKSQEVLEIEGALKASGCPAEKLAEATLEALKELWNKPPQFA